MQAVRIIREMINFILFAFFPFKYMKKILFFITMTSTQFVYASPGITYHGRILKPDGSALESSSVQFLMQIRSPGAENCLMYEESQTKNMTSSQGIFSLTLNDGTGTRSDTPTYSIDRIFSNRSILTFDSTRCDSGTTYTPTSGDKRKFIVYFKDSTMNTYEPMPIMSINYVPMSMASIESEQVGAFNSSSLLRAVDGSGNPTAAPALTPAQLTEFNALIGGISSKYVPAATAAGATVPSYTTASPPASPAAGSFWFDSTSLQLKYYDGSAVQTLGNAAGSSPTGAAGGDLSGTYPNPTLATITTAGKVSGNAITSGTIAGSTAINTSGNITTTGTVTAQNLSATSTNTRTLTLTNAGAQSMIIQPAATITGSPTFTWPGGIGSANQVLTTDGTTGALSWTTMTGAPTGGAGGDLGGTYPNPSVDKIKGTAVSATTPTTSGQVLRFNGTSWVPNFVAMTDIRSTVTGSTAFASSGCAANETLSWNSVGDILTCQAIGSLPGSAISSGTVAVARLGSGTADNTTYLRGDGAWVTAPADATKLPLAGGTMTGALAITKTGSDSLNPILTASGDGEPTLTINSSSAFDYFNPIISTSRSRGSQSSKTIVGNGDTLFELWIGGYDGSNNVSAARMAAVVDGTPGNNDMPTRLEFFTQADGAGSNLEGVTPEMVIKNTGNVGIGLASPTSLLHLQKTGTAGGSVSMFNIESEGEPFFVIRSADNSVLSNYLNPLLATYKSRGTLASPAVVQSGDTAFEMYMHGYDGSADKHLALISAYVDGTPGANDMPGRIEFHTQPDGSGATLEGTTPEMVIKSTGNIGIGNASPSYKLHVTNNAPAFAPQIAVNNQDTSANAFAQVAYIGDSRTFSTGIGNSTSTGYDVANKWFLYDLTSDAMRLVVNSSGNVGIGATTPLGKLDVVAPSNTRLLLNTDHLDLTSNADAGGWARAFRITQGNNTNGQDGGAFGAVGAGSTPDYAFMAIPTADGTGYDSTKIIALKNSGNVGIGATAPADKLHVYSTANGGGAGITIDNQGTSNVQQSWLNLLSLGNGATQLGNAASKGWSIFARGNAYSTAGEQNDLGFTYWNGSGWTAPVWIDSLTGNVGIGLTNPGYKLDVNGDVNIAAANALRFGGTSVCTSAGCTAVSDVRLKENIQPLENSLEKILQLQGVEYDYRDKSKFGDKHQIGVIAQNTEKVYPEVVVTDKKTGFKAVAYDHLVAPLIEAVKTLYNRIVGIEDNQATQARQIANVEASKADKAETDAKIKSLVTENTQLRTNDKAKDQKIKELEQRLEKIEKALSSK